MNLKDLKLNDMIKIALTATAILMVTLNIAIASNNTTVINNYIEKTTEKLDATIEQLNTIEKTGNETQSNVSKVKSDIKSNLAISKEILSEVN